MPMSENEGQPQRPSITQDRDGCFVVVVIAAGCFLMAPLLIIAIAIGIHALPVLLVVGAFILGAKLLGVYKK